MEKLIVKWNRSAYLQMICISTWYKENVALKAASSFIASIHKAIEQISSYPTIGMLDRKRSNARFKYHSVLLHPKYRLIYRVSKTTIRIVAIQCNLMNNDNN